MQTFTLNGASFNMIRVEGGKFQMGGTSEQGRYAEGDEKPEHQVTLSTFSIGETEVTQAVWLAVMGTNPAHFMGSNRPVENVSWDDCQEFIQKLNQLTGRNFRLPTEAEWEYAARGGQKSGGFMYSGSEKAGDVAWYTKNTHDSGSREVKTRQPNELGLYDMSGNVWEFCADWYRKAPDGKPSSNFHVIRGGAYDCDARYSRVTNRFMYDQRRRRMEVGFRLVLDTL
jgi:formylglycine-generating enzyme required for sulfatase activity